MQKSPFDGHAEKTEPHGTVNDRTDEHSHWLSDFRNVCYLRVGILANRLIWPIPYHRIPKREPLRQSCRDLLGSQSSPADAHFGNVADAQRRAHWALCRRRTRERQIAFERHGVTLQSRYEIERQLVMKDTIGRFALRIALVALLGLAAVGLILPAGEASARSKRYPTTQEVQCAFWSQQFSFYNQLYFNAQPGPERDAIAQNRDEAFSNMLSFC